MLKPALTKELVLKHQLFFGVLFLASQLAIAQAAIPKFQVYQSLSSKQSLQGVQSQNPGQARPVMTNEPYSDQNLKIQERAGMTVPGPTNVQSSRKYEDIQEDQGNNPIISSASYSSTNAFQRSYQEFLQLNPDSFSITKAVYLSESAFYDKSVLPTFQQFEIALKKRAELVRQIAKKEGLDEKDNIALNYAIQKLYNRSNEYFDVGTGNSYLVEKMKYDFDDFMGDTDWTKMYVNKLLHTGSGQCHSLPLLYLCIAEQLHAKAYLSLAPNHSFIQYFDPRGNRYNFETTNGNLVSQIWLAGSNFITAAAIKSKTYLDTLSSRRLYAQCLGDLLLSYLMKMRHYDYFSERLTKTILNVDPANITALMEQTNLKYLIFQNELRNAGNPPEQDFAKYPGLYTAYREYQFWQQKVEQTGFQEMPKEMYQQWLKSLDSEKRKQENKLEQERMELEIKKLKTMQPKLLIKNLK